jgi:hypothetical protein
MEPPQRSPLGAKRNATLNQSRIQAMFFELSRTMSGQKTPLVELWFKMNFENALQPGFVKYLVRRSMFNPTGSTAKIASEAFSVFARKTRLCKGLSCSSAVAKQKSTHQHHCKCQDCERKLHIPVPRGCIATRHPRGHNATEHHADTSRT